MTLTSKGNSSDSLNQFYISHFSTYRSSLITTKIDYYTAVFKQQQQKKTRAAGLLLPEEETLCLTHEERRTHPTAANDEYHWHQPALPLRLMNSTQTGTKSLLFFFICL